MKYDNYTDCFTDSEIEVLDKLLSHFEELIDENYDGEDVSLKYKRYLDDFTNRSLNVELFKNQKSKELLSEMKKSTLFNKVWILYSQRKVNETVGSQDKDYEIIPLNKDKSEKIEETEHGDFYILDFYGDYFNCLIENCKNKDIREAYKVVQKVSDISPSLFAGGLSIGFKDEDYNSINTKISITISFYYEMILSNK